MKHITPLVLIVAIALLAACTRYSYPENTAVPALSAQANLSSASSNGLTSASSSAQILDVSCQGDNYSLRVAYQHGFEKVTYQDLQYQIYAESNNSLRQITKPTGIVAIDNLESEGEVSFVIPSASFEEKESDVVVRLRLKTRQIIEATSPYDIIHIAGGCR